MWSISIDQKGIKLYIAEIKGNSQDLTLQPFISLVMQNRGNTTFPHCTFPPVIKLFRFHVPYPKSFWAPRSCHYSPTLTPFLARSSFCFFLILNSCFILFSWQLRKPQTANHPNLKSQPVFAVICPQFLRYTVVTGYLLPLHQLHPQHKYKLIALDWCD